MNPNRLLAGALWRIYRRPERPEPWATGGNLPWDDPDFSRRMLNEHLDDTHGAASRNATERALVIDWLCDRLDLAVEDRLVDVTCGPGLYAVELARRGVHVTGVDFAPAAIDYAVKAATRAGVTERCRFVREDVRKMKLTAEGFDAALMLYGQLAVFTRDEARQILAEISAALRPGGRLVVELLDIDSIDTADSTWWYTGNSGLWGDAPFLHLGERQWHADSNISVERFFVLHLETGAMDEIQLCDQAYEHAEMKTMMEDAGFARVAVYQEWDGLPLYDAAMKVVYVAQKA